MQLCRARAGAPSKRGTLDPSVSVRSGVAGLLVARQGRRCKHALPRKHPLARNPARSCTRIRSFGDPSFGSAARARRADYQASTRSYPALSREAGARRGARRCKRAWPTPPQIACGAAARSLMRAWRQVSGSTMTRLRPFRGTVKLQLRRHAVWARELISLASLDAPPWSRLDCIPSEHDRRTAPLMQDAHTHAVHANAPEARAAGQGQLCSSAACAWSSAACWWDWNASLHAGVGRKQH